ncbi:MAG: CDP-archaeol synthase [Candidatus Omnitrophica bacterium]|nr:CDP-archaeol synthase [Candidatus Omnitrophota bacterium]
MGISKKNLTKRLSSSAVIITIAYFVIFHVPVYVFLVAVEAFVLVALHEFFTIAEKKDIAVNKKLGLVFGAMLPLCVYFPYEPILVAAMLIVLFLVNFKQPQRSSSIVNVAVTFFGILYVAWFFSFLAKIRCVPYGPQWVCFLIFVIKMGDAGAYFIGSKFGKTQLTKYISPNKTVEGAIGGLMVAILSAMISKMYLPHIELLQLGLLGILLGVVAQIGDLAESLIKRDVGVKDSGAIPGLGGILDVLDSLLFTAPLLFYYLTVVLRIQ